MSEKPVATGSDGEIVETREANRHSARWMGSTSVEVAGTREAGEAGFVQNTSKKKRMNIELGWILTIVENWQAND